MSSLNIDDLQANSDAGGEQMGKWISATVARESSFSGNVLPVKRLTERAPYTILEAPGLSFARLTPFDKIHCCYSAAMRCWFHFLVGSVRTCLDRAYMRSLPRTFT